MISSVGFLCALSRPFLCETIWLIETHNNMYINITDHMIQEVEGDRRIGMREICPNNFGNNDGVKELSIIPAF